MRADHHGPTAIWLMWFAQQITASSISNMQHLSKRDAEPNLQWDYNTISTCSRWHDNDFTFTCKEVRDIMFAISPENFSRWNPSITLDCGNWQMLSYCVVVRDEQTPPSSTSTSSTPTPTPTAKPELLGWEYQGCYNKTYNSLNHTSNAGGSNLTIERCEASCFSDGFQYVGVKAGTECWCGTSLSNQWANDCNKACSGNSSETCGGSDSFNVFSARVKYVHDPWQALGCFARHPGILTGLLFSSTGTTQEFCIDECNAQGYLYAGLQSGSNCACGLEINKPAKLAPDACNLTCIGNPDEICGGESGVSIFADPSAPRPADSSDDDDSNDDGGSSDSDENTATNNLASPSVGVYLLATCLSISFFIVNF
ncbi:WSC-domain-containing protein [Xylaria telfairii]|nr:WSC-domain-containing protein [Xylaria telfairii]